MRESLKIKILTERDIYVAIDEHRKNESAINIEVEKKVEEIIAEVRLKGDEAVLNFGKKYDGIRPAKIEVTSEEVEEAYKETDNELIRALKHAAQRIEEFHKNQIERSWFTVSDDKTMLGQTVRGLDRVGVYIPGGTAAYPSSVLMNIIPARLAGVGEIIVATPPFKSKKAKIGILSAVKIAGGGRVFQIGGAQAIAAMAYGTNTIPKVDKITGPGNAYVAMAKAKCFGVVDIDMIAGPSEILIIADGGANVRYITTDMLSQAEHDERSTAILVTNSGELAQNVRTALDNELKYLDRAKVARSSIENNGYIVVCDNLENACEIANNIAPEHLEILTADPLNIFPLIRNAGSVFIGEFSPEALGDYMAGPNHVLPTGGTARFSSSLGVYSFQKKSSFVMASQDLLQSLSEDVVTIANYEGLKGHANAVLSRLGKKATEG